MAEAVSPEQRLDVLGGFADALPDPCFLLDRRSQVIHRNAAAADEFPEAMPASLLTSSLRFPALSSAIDQARRSGHAQTVELHRTVPNETWHRVHVAPLPADGWLVITLHSLTEERRMNQLRSDFVANASHELRTPLTSLIGFIDTLLGPAQKDDAARERFLNIMRQQAARMSNLIDDLLSLSRIEMRQHLRPTGSVDLSILLREVADGFESTAAAGGVTIEITAPEPAVVTGERTELYEVFENLIDNAIKYGGEADVALAEGEGQVEISISDKGPGIPIAEQEKVFAPFYRLERSRNRATGGSGLGLAVARSIIRAHGGDITLANRDGAGLVATVVLPV